MDSVNKLDPPANDPQGIILLVEEPDTHIYVKLLAWSVIMLLFTLCIMYVIYVNRERCTRQLTNITENQKNEQSVVIKLLEPDE